jgi:hypothetical protein
MNKINKIYKLRKRFEEFKKQSLSVDKSDLLAGMGSVKDSKVVVFLCLLK